MHPSNRGNGTGNIHSSRAEIAVTHSASSRRSFLAALGAMPALAIQRSAPSSQYWTKEYWVQKGDVRLYLYRKRRSAPKPGETALPVLVLVHGSSLSGRSTFDLQARGIGDYSLMNAFAGYGFDVWTMDFEGYGRSTRTSGNSNIAEGVKDLVAATNVVTSETRQPRLHFFGESSGGLRVGAFAMANPDRVGRLVLAALPIRDRDRRHCRTGRSNSIFIARITPVHVIVK